MIISTIVAISENNVIGFQNNLPWHLPDDLKLFKQLTTKHCILMGRVTHKSIGKPLPHRHNIILTNNSQVFPGCYSVKSFQEALELTATLEHDQLFIIDLNCVRA